MINEMIPGGGKKGERFAVDYERLRGETRRSTIDHTGGMVDYEDAAACGQFLGYHSTASTHGAWRVNDRPLISWRVINDHDDHWLPKISHPLNSISLLGS